MEIIRRIDNSDIQGARSLADSFLDAQINLVEQLAKGPISEEEKRKASEIVLRVNEYRAAHNKAESN